MAGMAKRNASENWKQGLVGMGPKSKGEIGRTERLW